MKVFEGSPEGMMNYLNKLKQEYGDVRIFNRPPDMDGVELKDYALNSEAWGDREEEVKGRTEKNQEWYLRNVLCLPDGIINSYRGE